MCYLSDICFWQYFVYLQPWLRLFCYHIWSTIHFPPVFPFKTSILPQIECEKAVYRMVCMRFSFMCYLSDMFFRQYYIIFEPWTRLFCCHIWSTIYCCPVFPFKTSVLAQIECEKAIYRMVCMRF